jgi:acylphosphatase
MTKARFYIKGKVQDVGYRPYIMKEVIKREGLNGIADNYKEDSVEVLLEGEENKILVDFYDFFKKEENKPREAEVKEISELEFLNSTSVHVPKASEYSQALTFEQLGKGIPILKNMYRSIEGMSTRIEGMSTRIEGMDENISGMREETKDGFNRMSNEMREGFDKLPKGIAQELKNFLSEER